MVGQERLQLALILCAVHPGIGGVLVRGEKGTAKSTVVRALAQLLPPVVDETGARPARLVELPVGATEDRVVGSLDLERVLRDGEQAFRPGLLAAAHHGVLYVDEVNLLHDHLVDVLLDAAAMGRVHIERDGVSHSHPARFVLVGTMNPEEGELRPQLLDRFGLTVDVAASRDVDVRMAVVRRRLDYEADPAGFAARYTAADREVAERILTARDRLPEVALDDVELRRIAALCAAFDVDGMRADLVVARTATAHAAWRGSATVTEDDVRVAAELALPHRRRRDPFDEPGISEDQLDEAMRDAAEEAERTPEPESGAGGTDTEDARDEHAGDSAEPQDGPDDDPDGGPDSPGGGQDSPEGRGTGRTGTPAPSSVAPPRWEVPGVGEGAPGRRSRAQTRQGRMVRPDTGTTGGLHLLGTVFAAAPHQRARGRASGPLRFESDDLRGAYREGREGNLVVFVVDASGSMSARDRLSAVTGAVVSLLRDAYQRRDKVAVITVRGADAELVLPPTSSVDIAVRRLSGMRTGGKTPLAAGLLKAREVVARERVRDPRRRPMLVLLTDGRATGGTDPVIRARAAARLLAMDAVTAMVVDCERGMIRLGLAAELARELRGECVRLGELTGDAVAGVVRESARATDTGGGRAA
ncbi:magnesium chelatase subunit D family protein [Nocardia cyriacigeorgica]|uniref:Magnesium chelatase subunit D family protein n=1 Tax=Nocardia cyriacigeorgica TaxID=135487 RepID=A0ABX0CGX5_9NOCA|nr:magnesium chelatase subunit D family protein [Nocardia cyriacigeorgica]NEW39277.1 magnesium chelatase subunit D family protein [Nocardia cyriacigeorgica]NEW49782.1 magnesium chelatase subunit D family protein [Nocardia cyriacigeorgica]NEW54517.1 magnesium chelatase subunit D family protein [Nocardia cyriacigeorgica]